MSKYPLEWGWHHQPELEKTSSIPTSPKATLLGRKSREDGDVDIAATGDLRCEACPKGGSWGTTGSYNVEDRILCRACAVKQLGVGNEPSNEQYKALRPFELKGR
jgi:hypothetical protein